MARFLPAPFNPKPIVYLRSLMIGKLKRAHEITGGDATAMIHMAWHLLCEVTRGDRRYSWRQCHRALAGIRHQWARESLRALRDATRLLAALQHAEDLAWENTKLTWMLAARLP